MTALLLVLAVLGFFAYAVVVEECPWTRVVLGALERILPSAGDDR